MSVSKADIIKLRFSLQQAVVSCSERCQYQSTRWAAELLDALPDDDDDVDHDPASLAQIFNTQTDPVELALERNEVAKYLMAKSFFDCHEFRRCASVFLPASSSDHRFLMLKDPLDTRHDKITAPMAKEISQKGLFLSSYALLMAGEKEKVEELSQVLGPSDTGAVVNKQLTPLKHTLESWLEQKREESPEFRPSQGWLEYMYGVVLSKDRLYELAISWLLKSVALYPWNWGAWQELKSLVRNAHHLNWIQSQLKPSIMAFIFSVHCRQELHQYSPSLISEISQLQSIFPRSLFVAGQRALVFYRMKDLHEASSLFSEMLVSDPRHLDFLDHYSNVLYTLDSRSKLAFVAQIASSVDQYRPETCCIIGNYYSLSSLHEAAVIYFMRALKLDRSFSSAWTLLGHEFYKLENTHAAIESYRHAVDLNNKDYRAFVGLAQVYEVLERPSFSLYYYRRAVELRPGDVDLWQMMATCMANMSRIPQAIDALKRAIACTKYLPRKVPENALDSKWRRIELLFQLASMHEESQNHQEAITYLETCLEEADAVENGGNIVGSTRSTAVSIITKARLLLARLLAAHGDYSRARYLASRIDQDSEFANEAQDMLRTFPTEEDAGSRE